MLIVNITYLGFYNDSCFLPMFLAKMLTPSYFLSWKAASLCLCLSLSLPPSLPPSCLSPSSFSLPLCCFAFSVWVLLTKMPLFSAPLLPWWGVGRGRYMLILLGEDYLAWLWPSQMPDPSWDTPQPTHWPQQPEQGFSVSPSLTHCPLYCPAVHWYPGETEGHVKLGSASLQVYSEPALGPLLLQSSGEGFFKAHLSRHYALQVTQPPCISHSAGSSAGSALVIT